MVTLNATLVAVPVSAHIRSLMENANTAETASKRPSKDAMMEITMLTTDAHQLALLSQEQDVVLIRMDSHNVLLTHVETEDSTLENNATVEYIQNLSLTQKYEFAVNLACSR